jgi:NTP pyrophosphatase (non-canonical NTP hydrolase)
MDLQALSRRALEIRRQYAEQERAAYGRPWTTEEIALGFVGDVGDLAKLVVACAGMRALPDARAKLAHELADCLWSILVLADVHGIDLEQEFLRTMQELEGRIASGQ